MYAASAMAANTVTRSAAGASAPLFTQYMFDALGVGGGGSLIGGIAVLLVPIPFIFYRYGGLIRKRSKFAPTNDGGMKDGTRQTPVQGTDDLEAATGSSSISVTTASDTNEGDSDDTKDIERSEPIEKTRDANHEEPAGSNLGKDLEKEAFEPLKGNITQ